MRVSNKVAVAMYNKLGYTVYRRVLEYYSGDVDEDAFGKYHYMLMARSNMSPVVTEPVFGVSDKVQHKPGFAVTEYGQSLENFGFRK